MRRFHLVNAIFMVLGIGISVMGAFFGEKGILLRQGGPFGLGDFFTLKGASLLPCRMSDVSIVTAAFSLIALAKTY